MALCCPYCGQSISVRGAGPGQYAPKCPKCARAFLLTVSQEDAAPGAKMTAAPLGPEGPQPAGPPAEPDPRTDAKADDVTLDWIPRRDALPRDADGTEPTIAVEVRGGPREAAEEESRGVPSPMTAAEEAGLLAGGVPERLGGYHILKPLGQGAMGAVYLARQASLDRDVALKTIHRRMSQDPVFVARFTREAYAAAQLVHHNVVQIYDLGVDRSVHYFSMEYVDGQTLAQLVKRHGRLEPEVAVGYVLQAARALKFAHDHGMVHRDVKPGNLLLNAHGVVKLADLGIVKVPPRAGPAAGPLPAEGESPAGPPPSTPEATLSSRIMGTPAYMAPEQSEDATRVDARADIYSLGCTLYDLLTGRPPFRGTTAREIITKHRTEPVVRPDLLVDRVPKELSAVVMRMVAKSPSDRYQDLGEVIGDLERFLGISEAGSVVRWEEHAKTLEQCADRFHACPMARLRSQVLLGLFSLCTTLLLLGIVLSRPLFVGGVAGAMLLGAAAYFVVSGSMEKTYLFTKVRALALGFGGRDWLVGIGTVLLLWLVLWLFGYLAVWLVLFLLTAGGAVAFYVFVDRRIGLWRAEPIRKVQEMLKGLRLRGEEEAAIQRFVARYAGEGWEEFFEALFGYEAKLAARRAWGLGEGGRPRKRFGGWRDPVIRWIDDNLRARQEEKDRKHLQGVEENGLLAEGVSAAEARVRAENAAQAMVCRAAELRGSVSRRSPRDAAAEKSPSVQTALESAREAGFRRGVDWLGAIGGAISFLLNAVFGQRTRFLLGCLLVAGCVLWMHQNGMIERFPATYEKVRDEVRAAVEEGRAESLLEKTGPLAVELSGEHRPLDWPPVPREWTEPFSSFNPGVAGLVLILSSLVGGWKIAAFLFPAAAIMVLGHTTGVPGLLEPMANSVVSLGAGLGLALAGFIFGRE